MDNLPVPARLLMRQIGRAVVLLGAKAVAPLLRQMADSLEAGIPVPVETSPAHHTGCREKWVRHG